MELMARTVFSALLVSLAEDLQTEEVPEVLPSEAAPVSLSPAEVLIVITAPLSS